ncbi:MULTISPECIES: hypothetical protein [unclassified Microbacterium]|uniref:hypothetical protein n=1 Tax=unclassified Microbacterium TaxID=2609290 RepID=UPI00365F2085
MTERSRSIAVTGAHRAVRALADGEGPFDGELVTRGNGMAVRVDAAQLRGWAGWAFAGAEHVAAPLDLALSTDGQDVLLPWCVRTVSAHLAQATDAGGLAHGEAVTLAVSVLRGVLELEGEQDDPADVARADAGADRDADVALYGGWWLTDEARPLFAIGSTDALDAGGTPRETGERLLRDLEARVEDRALRRVLTRLGDALDEPRRLRAEAARWERELLEIAAPRPLRLDVDGAADPSVEAPGEGIQGRALSRADLREGEHRPLRRELRGAARSGGRRAPAARERRGAALTRRLGGERGPGASAPVSVSTVIRRLRDARAHMGERVGRRASIRGRAHERSRGVAAPSERSIGRKRWKGPVLVAVSAAAVIAVVGALWPSGTGNADAADTTPGATSTRVSASATPYPPVPTPAESVDTPAETGGGGATPVASGRTPAPGASSRSDPRAAAEELIAATRNCRERPQPECAEVWDGGAAGARPLRAADGPPVLIEDYGDIAAIRNSSDDGAQMVVIIRRNAEWRIRDVYDIANPPSEGTGAP